MKAARVLFSVSTLSGIERLRVVESPCLTRYLNHAELVIGFGKGVIEVGLNVGTKKRPYVVDVSKCACFANVLVNGVHVFRKFVRESKALVFDAESGNGFWKTVEFRVSTRDDLLIVVNVAGEVPENIVEEAKQLMVQWRWLSGIVFDGAKWKVVVGEDGVSDLFCGMVFRVGPGDRFPENIAAAEGIVMALLDDKGIDSETVLLVTEFEYSAIPLALARHCDKVVLIGGQHAGIDAFCEMNDVRNVAEIGKEFENASQELSAEIGHRGKKAVLLLGVGDCGGRKAIYNAVQEMPCIKTIAMLSPKVERLVEDAKNELLRAEEWTLTSSLGFDCCPHTDRVELLLILRRRDSDHDASSPSDRPKDALASMNEN
jgi:hypothetical protein